MAIWAFRLDPVSYQADVKINGNWVAVQLKCQKLPPCAALPRTTYYYSIQLSTPLWKSCLRPWTNDHNTCKTDCPSFWYLYQAHFLPHTHAQGLKQSVLSVVCCRHKNRHIWISRHLSDLQAQQILQNWQKTGFTVLRIVWHSPRTSQIACFVGHAYRPHLPQAMCFLLMRTTAKHV